MTGASSFLGKSLGERLLNEGYNLHVIIRASTKKERLPKGLLPENIYIYDGSSESIVSAVNRSRPDTVFHLASLYSRETSIDLVEPMVNSNLLIGILVMEALRDAKILASIVIFGTYTQYYQINGRIQSLNVYAALKNAFTEIIALYAEDLGLGLLDLILYDSYGIGDWRDKLLPTIKDAIKSDVPLHLSDPNLIIDLTNMTDVVSGVICAQEILSSKPISSQSKRIYSISGDRLSLFDLMEKVQTVIGHKLTIRWNSYQMPKNRIIEPWLGSKPPNWKPNISLDQGLKSYLLEDNFPK